MQEALLTLLASLPRVTWGQRPQASALPAVVLTVVGESPAYTYASGVRLRSTRVQADIYAGTYAEAVEIDRQLVPRVDGYRGAVGDTTFAGIFLESRFDAVETPAAGATPIHRISRDLMVKHKEA